MPKLLLGSTAHLKERIEELEADNRELVRVLIDLVEWANCIDMKEHMELPDPPVDNATLIINKHKEK